MTQKIVLRAFMAALALGLMWPGAGEANDIVYFKTFFDTDFASFGYGGMRGGDGTGTLTVNGVSGTVTEAYLYWHGPTNTSNSTANANIQFAGNSIVGTNIGLSNDNCWGYLNSQAYRADVTQYVNGDGSYSLANLIKQDVDINGASLLVAFDDGDTGNNRDVVLFNGNDSNIDNPYDAPGWNVTLANINYQGGSASMELGVSDGQSFPDDAVLVNGNTVAASGGIFQGLSVPNGPTAGTTNGGLWDIMGWAIDPYLSQGINNVSLTTGVNSDCLSLIHATVNLPAGAAPPPIPEPTTVLLLGAGIAGLAARSRRRR